MRAYAVTKTLKVKQTVVVNANTKEEAEKAAKQGEGVAISRQIANTVNSVKQYNY